MGLLRSIAAAFSLYSRIPMPSFEWKDEDMRFCMCAFPLVGVIEAVLAVLVFELLGYFDIGILFSAAIMTALPVLYTGGIHMDGLLDTYDALCSYGDKDKKLEILKDPHIGGFAVIRTIVYVLIAFGCFGELTERTVSHGADTYIIYAVAGGYIVSRILSAISVIRFRKAKDEGMVSAISESNDRKCFAILIVILITVIAAGALLLGRYAFVWLAALPVFAYYRYRSYRDFGGITGDLAGWFLQLCELAFLITATVFSIFW